MSEEPSTPAAAGASRQPEHGPWIDVHAHPGACFMAGLDADHPATRLLGGDRTETAASDIVRSAVTVTSFSTVADLISIGIGSNGSPAAVRPFDDATGVADHDRQLAALAAVAGATELVEVRTPDDVIRLHAAGDSGYFVSCEGGDFIGTAPERVAHAHDCGVCAITLVHYRVNEIGDIQTEDAVHGGLTDVGRDVVREMNRFGMVVDLAHATQQTTADAASESSSPIVISHSHLASPGADHPRLLSAEHALIVAASGGVVGAWPAGVVATTLADYVEEICRLIDVIGIEHVAIGTDMDANYRPVLDHYDQMATVGDLLGERGLDAAEVDAVMGGNYLRVWRAAEAAASA